MPARFSLDLVSSVTAPVPRAEVRAVFEDTRSWPEWCGPVDRVVVAPTAWKAGERLHYVLASVAKVPFDVVLDEVDEEHITWSSTKGPITGIRTWRFEERDGQTTITDTKRFESDWVPVAAVYPRFVVRRMSENWLADLVTEATRRAS